MVVVCFAGQQAVRAHRNGLLKQASARAADDRQPLDHASVVHQLDLHRRAVFRQVAPGSQLLLDLVGQAFHGVQLDLSHPAAAVGKGLQVLHPEDARQHLVDAALGRVQVRVHTDGGDPRPHQLTGYLLRADLFQRGKDDRMVRHDDLTVLPGRFLYHFGRDVQRHQHLLHRAAAVHQQTGVVPALCQFQRGNALHFFIYLLNRCHCSVPPFRIASISSASGVPSGTPRRKRGSLAFCQAA